MCSLPWKPLKYQFPAFQNIVSILQTGELFCILDQQSLADGVLLELLFLITQLGCPRNCHLFEEKVLFSRYLDFCFFMNLETLKFMNDIIMNITAYQKVSFLLFVLNVNLMKYQCNLLTTILTYFQFIFQAWKLVPDPFF